MKQRVLNVVGTLWDRWPTINAIDQTFEARYISFYAPSLAGRISTSKVINLHERFTNKLLWPYKLIRRNYRIIQTIRSFDPQYVVSQHDDANFSILPSVLWCRLFRKNVKFIAWVRADPEKGYSDSFYSAVVRVLAHTVYICFDAVVTPSYGNEEKIVQYYHLPKKRVHVIHNPVDTKEMRSYASAALDKSHAKLLTGTVLLTVGRLTEQKGQWHMLRAFAEVKKRIPDANLVILNDGELRGYLVELAKELGIAESVHFLGFQKNPIKYMNRSKLFILSSLWETFGNVLIESMSVGVPVVSTNCRSGPQEIIADEARYKASRDIEHAAYGVLTPALDGKKRDASEPLTKEEKLFAKAILELLRNKALYKKYSALGKKRAQQFAIEQFDFAGEFRRITQ